MDNDIWQRFNEDFSTHLLGVQRAETRAIEAETRTILERTERVMQDKPKSRREDRA